MQQAGSIVIIYLIIDHCHEVRLGDMRIGTLAVVKGVRNIETYVLTREPKVVGNFLTGIYVAIAP